MFDPSFDRILSYRLSSAYDYWGHRRSLRRGIQHGIWFLDPTGIDEPPACDTQIDTSATREQRLAEFQSSGRFSAIEIATLHALIVERLTIAEIARRDGCSRQAVVARLVWNSRRQGGILKKARALRQQERSHYLLDVPSLNDEGMEFCRNGSEPPEPVHRSDSGRKRTP